MDRMKITHKDVGRSYIARNGNIYTIMSYDENKLRPFEIYGYGLTERIDENGCLWEGVKFCVDFVRWLDDEKDQLINKGKKEVEDLKTYARNITIVAIAGWIVALFLLLNYVIRSL